MPEDTNPRRDTDEASLACANCGQPLDPTDKFCRECGLPTVRQAQAQHAAPAAPPDMGELKRAMEAAPDPRPFLRPDLEPEPPADAGNEPTTGSVVRVTSPTFAASLAASTLVMVGIILVLAVIGIALLFMAFRP